VSHDCIQIRENVRGWDPQDAIAIAAKIFIPFGIESRLITSVVRLTVDFQRE
jgi:hypothetical protein